MAEVLELAQYEVLYLHRKRARLTQKEMADQLEVSINTYCDLELGLKLSPRWIKILDEDLRVFNKYKNYPPSSLETCILLRRRRGWFQQRLANELGVSRNWVNRMEAGKENPEPLFKYWNL